MDMVQWSQWSIVQLRRCNAADQQVGLEALIAQLLPGLRSRSEDEQVNAAVALGSLACSGVFSSKEAIARDGGIESLIAVLRAGSERAQISAANALGTLATNMPDIQVAIVRAGGREALEAQALEALKRDSSGAAKQSAALVALQLLADAGPAPTAADAPLTGKLSHSPRQAELLTGKRVLISGVVGRPELNGTHGIATVWIEVGGGRYAVRLHDGTDVLLSPANLDAAQHQSVDDPAKWQLPLSVVGGLSGDRADAVTTWLEGGGHVDARASLLEGVCGITMLMLACTKGYESVVEKLLEHNASPNLVDEPSSGSALLHALGAARSSSNKAPHLRNVRRLLEAGADVNLQDKDGICPLVGACQLGDQGLVEALIVHKADVNLADGQGATPIIDAVMLNHLGVVKVLLNAGARADVTADGNTPLSLARERGFKEVEKVLLDEKDLQEIQAEEYTAERIESLVEQLRSGSVEEQRTAAFDLGNLAKNNSKKAVAYDSSIEALVALLRGGSARVQAPAAGALGRLAGSPDPNADIQAAIAQAGGIELLVALVREGGADAQEEAAGALGALVQKNANIKEAIMRSGGVEPLVALLREGSEGAQEYACEALATLAEDNTANQNAITDVGGSEALEELVCVGSGHMKRCAANALAFVTAAAKKAIAQEKADAAMEALLAEEDDEKAKAEAKRSKSKTKKGKGRVKLPGDGGSGTSSQGHVSGAEQSPAAVNAEAERATSHAEDSTAADQALQVAMQQGEFEALAAALESHGATASDSVRSEARTLRDKLRDKRKKQSQKLKRAHAGAMEGLAALQTAIGSSDAQALRQAVARAESLATERPEIFAEELGVARERLEALSLGSQPAATVAEDDPAPPPASALASEPQPGAIALTLTELAAATEGFCERKLIGSGGYGRVFIADTLPSLQPEALPSRLRHLPVAVKRAKSGTHKLADLQREVTVLQQCHHPHLLPLLGYYLALDSPCLIFPLMRGGSFADRLRPSAADPEHLSRLGLSAPLHPLQWRERLAILRQATDALHYLHTPVAGGKGFVVHRDFKPENILLDDNLHAYLADTGFAKMDTMPEASKKKSASNALYLTMGYLDPSIVAGGDYSALTDGWALGITMLVALTARSPISIIKKCEESFDEDFEEIDAAKLADAEAGWPTHVARAIKDLVLSDASRKCLCHPKDRKKLNVADVLAVLTSSLAASGDDASGGAGPCEGVASSAAPVATQALAGSPAHTPLSLQVHGLRGAEAPEQSVKRNVSEAFDRYMRRLDSLFESGRASAPSEFIERIDYWHASCGLPEEVRSRMQKLRIWRNASLHHDDARWAKDGPRSADEASRRIAELETRVRALEPGAS